MTNRPTRPLFATVNVTTACNLDCSYCFMQPRAGVDMEMADFYKAIDALEEAEIFLLNLSGGEPFMHSQFATIFLEAHRRFTHVMTLTNGTILRAEHQRAIRQVLDEKPAVTLQVSLDAVDAAVNRQTRTGSQATLRNLGRLTGLGAHVIVAIVVTRHNYVTIPDTIQRLSDVTRYFHVMTIQDIRQVAGVKESHDVTTEHEFALWDELGALAAELGLFINTPLGYGEVDGCAEGAPCMAGFSHLVIDPDLRVRPCDRLVDVFVGDLAGQTIDEIWNSPLLEPILTGSEPYCRQSRSRSVQIGTALDTG